MSSSAGQMKEHLNAELAKQPRLLSPPMMSVCLDSPSRDGSFGSNSRGRDPGWEQRREASHLPTGLRTSRSEPKLVGRHHDVTAERRYHRSMRQISLNHREARWSAGPERATEDN